MTEIEQLREEKRPATSPMKAKQFHILCQILAETKKPCALRASLIGLLFPEIGRILDLLADLSRTSQSDEFGPVSAEEMGQPEVVRFARPAFVPNWIPVTVAMPEHGQEVFFARYGIVHRGEYHTGSSDGKVPRFVSSGGMRYWYPQEHVTHWMPSPTPEPPVT